MSKMKYSLVVLLCCVGAALCNPTSLLDKISGCFGGADSSESEADDINECLRVRPNDHGHVKVRTGVHLFYWLRRKEEMETDSPTIPLAIFLDGGPGKAVTGDSNFGGIGPCNRKLERHEYAWTKHMHVLLIDSPVGAGFSYFDDEKYAADSDTRVVEDLYLLLAHFFTDHNELRKAPLHIFGASYGAKTAVKLALKLEEIEFDCNLQSVTSLCGWISPVDTVSVYADILLQKGFIDKHHSKEINQRMNDVQQKLKNKTFNEARKANDHTLEHIVRIFGVNVYNVMTPQPVSQKNQTPDVKTSIMGDSKRDLELAELMKGRVSKALKIKREWIPMAVISQEALFNVFYESAHDDVEKLLKTKIKVNIVTGQHDFIVSTSSTVNWLEKLVKSAWDDVSHDGKKRGIITIKRRLEGYFMKHNKLTQYTVLNGGHSFQSENPAAMEWILKKILKEELSSANN